MTVPLVSVVMSVYNGARDTPKAVTSILEQTFTDFELIAIDNGSNTDNPREVLKGLAARDARLILIPLDCLAGGADTMCAD